MPHATRQQASTGAAAQHRSSSGTPEQDSLLLKVKDPMPGKTAYCSSRESTTAAWRPRLHQEQDQHAV